MNSYCKKLLFSLFILWSINPQAQEFANVTVFGLQNVLSFPSKLIGQVNSKNASQKAKEIHTEIIKQGYLASSIDSIKLPDSTLSKPVIYFKLGDQYKWLNLIVDEPNKQLLNYAGLAANNFEEKPINPYHFSQIITKIITYYENNGYPFVQVSLAAVTVEKTTVKAFLKIDKGPLIRLKKIIIKGDDTIDPKIISTIIGLKEGAVFDQKLVYEIGSRIKETPYFEEIRPAEYEFIGDDCFVYLYVKNKNANSFNAIIGILPKDNGKFTITGDTRIRLVNMLHKGELIDINWRKLLPLTQNLNLHLNYPFLFQTNFGFDTKFDLYKKDTSYIDLNASFGISYRLTTNLQLTAYFNTRNANLISTAAYQYIQTLPNFADISVNSYGTALKYTALDYKYNPRKGLDVLLDVSAGSKKIKKNTGLNEQVYEGIALNSSNYKGTIDANYFIPIKKRGAFKTGINAGFIINETLFENELFRIGGNRSLRGFDEESIFGSSYLIGTLEYRYLFEENSAFFGFLEGAAVEKNNFRNYSKSTLYSFGVGLNFQTKPGIFSLSYALGAVTNNPISVRSAKIHFGFINYF